MTETPAERKKRFRFWITLSELVGVLALGIAGLNYWDSHRQHADDTRREAAAGAAHSALVLEADMEADGARLALRPANAAQVVQSQRYLFPYAVLGHAMEVSAARPQIDLDWIAGGLRAEIARARKAGSAGADGEGSIPVGVFTTYVEDGDVLTDASLYRLGYAWRGRLFGGPKLALQGISLVRRAVKGDLRQAVEVAGPRRVGASK